MSTMRIAVGIFSVSVMVLRLDVVSGQDYPNRPIRMVAAPAGGGNDFIARIVAQGVSGPLGQAVIVDNRPARLTQEIVSKAPPDGYTLLVAGGTFTLAPLLEKTPYDPVKDFAPITSTTKSPNVLVVHPSLPVTSVKELIALAKARPGALNYGASGVGSPSHLAPELFKAMAGVNIVRVSYKGAGPALNDLLGGQVQLSIISAASVAPHVKSGRLRALAVTSARPSELTPGLPTIAASGLPGYEVVSIDSILAPAKTPAAVIKRLNQEIVRVLNQADVKEKFLNAGSEVAPSSPEELAATIKSEMAKWDKVIKDAGIRAD